MASVVSQTANGSQLDGYGFLTNDALALTSPDTIDNIQHSQNCHHNWLIMAPCGYQQSLQKEICCLLKPTFLIGLQALDFPDPSGFMLWIHRIFVCTSILMNL
jgi:hypothetical protein